MNARVATVLVLIVTAALAAWAGVTISPPPGVGAGIGAAAGGTADFAWVAATNVIEITNVTYATNADVSGTSSGLLTQLEIDQLASTNQPGDGLVLHATADGRTGYWSAVVAGGDPQTPWAADIDAAGYSVFNVSTGAFATILLGDGPIADQFYPLTSNPSNYLTAEVDPLAYAAATNAQWRVAALESTGYRPLASVTLTAVASSITFENIEQLPGDLMVSINALRSTNATPTPLTITVNGITAGVYYRCQIQANMQNAEATSESDAAAWTILQIPQTNSVGPGLFRGWIADYADPSNRPGMLALTGTHYGTAATNMRAGAKYFFMATSTNVHSITITAQGMMPGTTARIARFSP